MSKPDGGTATFVQRRNQRLREAMAFLDSRPAGADKTEIEFHVASAVPPTPDDLELNSSGVLKWLTAFHWYSTAFTRSGWLIKDGSGHWAITDAGREALKEHSDPEDFNATASNLYAQWYAAHKAPRPRPWLIRGSSVSGHNLVPLWLSEGFVSLPAKNLTELPDPTRSPSCGPLSTRATPAGRRPTADRS